MIRLHLILSYVVSYLHILSYTSLDLCLVLCTLPPLMSYSLAPSSTMMSCTVHSPTDSLAQPSCTVVYIVCNPAPRDSPFELSLGLCSNSRVLSSPPSQSPLVWWFVLGSPWVASLVYLVSCFDFMHLADFSRYGFDSSASMVRPNESVRMICMADGWLR